MFGFFKKKNTGKETEHKIVTLPADDAVLATYQEEAQDGLPYLIEFMAEHDEGDELFRYAVKTNFEENGNSEHMWVQVTKFEDGFFYGKLVNQPSTMKLVKYGDPIKIARTDVEDWVLEDFLTNTKVGSFSSKYLRGKGK